MQTFIVISSHITNICDKCRRNPSTNYRDIAKCKNGVNRQWIDIRQTDGWHIWKHIASIVDSSMVKVNQTLVNDTSKQWKIMPNKQTIYHPFLSESPCQSESVRTLCSMSFLQSIPSDITRFHSWDTSSAAHNDLASTYDKICSAMWSNPRAVKHNTACQLCLL